jgi:hypothetical protein
MTARWIPILLMAAISAPGWGQSQSQDHFALTAGQVARALCERGIQTADKQVSLPARVVATEPEPILDILSVETLGEAPSAKHFQVRSRVKLACRLPGRCLPFYVIVSGPELAGEPATIASITSPIARNANASASPAARNALLNASSDITMRAGTRAMLVMDDHRSHIQVTVISLENGIVGHRIRVASPDHKQMYFGEVVTASLLKGSF